MFKKIFLLLAMVLLIVAGLATFRELNGQHNVVINFANRKHLMVDDLVYLSGTQAGKVKTVETERRQVTVTINLQENFYNQISSSSTFFIDKDLLDPEKQCLLIRLTRQPGQPISPDTRLTGTDSAFTWAVMQAGDQMAAITRSDPVKKGADDLEKVWQDIRQAFEDIDLGKMERELREKSESLRRNFNKALDAEGLKQTLAEIETKLKELQQTLKEAGDSEAAQKLKQNLKELFKRLQKQAPERSDVKI